MLKGEPEASSQGFSFVELAFVILLLGFIFLLTFPNFRDWMAPRDMKRAVLGFVGTLRYAQSQAAMTKRAHRLNIDMKENVFWLTREEEKGRFAREATPHGQSSSLPGGIWFVDVYHSERGKIREGIAFIEFSPTGWAEECAIHLRKSEEEIYTIFVYPLGGKIEVASGYWERIRG